MRRLRWNLKALLFLVTIAAIASLFASNFYQSRLQLSEYRTDQIITFEHVRSLELLEIRNKEFWGINAVPGGVKILVIAERRDSSTAANILSHWGETCEPPIRIEAVYKQ
jgi:hypothetical protein